MNRLSSVMLLLCAGMLMLSPALSASSPAITEIVNSELTNVEKQVLKQAAREIGYSYEDLVSLHARGWVIISQIDPVVHKVTVLSESGNPIISVLIDSL